MIEFYANGFGVVLLIPVPVGVEEELIFILKGLFVWAVLADAAPEAKGFCTALAAGIVIPTGVVIELVGVEVWITKGFGFALLLALVINGLL